MAYNTALEEKLDRQSAGWPNLTKKKMFGGIGYLVNGNMVVGVNKDYLMLRLSKEMGEAVRHEPYFEPFGMTGKTMAGWGLLTSEGWERDSILEKWVWQCLEYVLTLPPK